MKVNFVGVLCFVAGAALVASTLERGIKPPPVNDRLLSTIVGSVDGHCCKPGRRYGCDPSNFPQEYTECSKETNECNGDVVMYCDNASCAAADASDTCNYTPQLVGRNRCKFAKESCGTETVCEEVLIGYEPVLCWNPFYGWYVCGYTPVTQNVCQEVEKFKCVPSTKSTWRDDTSPVIRSVCDGGTTCTYAYGACQG